MLKKHYIYWTIGILVLAALTALSFWGWTKMGLAAFQGGLAVC